MSTATENRTDDMRLARATSAAMKWPSLSDLMRDYGVTRAFVRGAIDSGAVRAANLDRIRVEPHSWERFLEKRLSSARRDA